MCPAGKKYKSRRIDNNWCECMKGDFMNMMKLTDKCCPDMGQMPDCATMMKNMIEMCCSSKTDSTKPDAAHQKESEK